MQLRKLLLPGLLSVTLLSGCSLFNSEEDVVKMSPLPTVENQFTPTTAWSTSVGSGIGNFYSNLHPALADNVVYAADRAGLVKALNADDGKEIWSVSLAEKDGWFSKEPALTPIRIGIFCCFAKLTTFSIFSLLPIFPGFRRSAEIPLLIHWIASL